MALRNFFRFAWVITSLSFVLPVFAQVNVVTYHNNNGRTGENLKETILTPVNVNPTDFGKLFTYELDGHVYAQPLVVSGVKIPGQGAHTVVFVATEHNSVYAFDAASNTGASGGLFWQVNLGPSAATPNPDFGNRYGGFDEITPEVGITGTPVIDAGSGTLYVDAFTHEGGDYIHRIHALDIATGAERAFSPVIVSASIPGTGAGSVEGVLTFEARQQLQRSALTLSDGILYVNFAGFSDTDPYHGWIIGFDPHTLKTLPAYVFNTTPNSSTAEFGENAGEGGIWMAGCGLSVDSAGNMYFGVGNGSFNAFSGGTEYGNSFIKLSTARGFSVADYFTPYNQDYLAENDLDVGSGGVLLLPDQPAPLRHLMVAGGKTGLIYLMNRDQMTSDNSHYNPTATEEKVVQTVSIGGGLFSTPAYFDGRLYFAGNNDVLRAFSLENGTLSIPPDSAGPSVFRFPGATPSVSANKDKNGIIWAVARGTPAVLRAYDAKNLTAEIYNSELTGARDQLPAGVKFAVPTVANGKVYVGGQNALSVFGLLPGNEPTPATDMPARRYNGLFFEAAGIRPESSGAMSAKVTKLGGFTGNIQQGKGRFRFSGRFDSSGASTLTIFRKNDLPLTLELQMDTSDFNRITGTVSDGIWTADMRAEASVFSARTASCPFAGQYTLILPGPGDGDPETPQGDSFGSVKIATSGQVKFAGVLADGTKMTQSATVSGSGDWPLYVPAYRGQGEILGWIHSGDDASPITWVKLPDPRATLFPDGFSLELLPITSAFQSPKVRSALDFSNGILNLSGGNLPDEIINAVAVAGNKVLNQSSNKLRLQLKASSGFFTGTVTDPASGNMLKFSGAILQNQNYGSGFFLWQNESGRVYFGPP